MPVIGDIAAKLATAGLSSRAARFAAWAIVAIFVGLIAWGAWSLWLSDHDAAVIRDDRAASSVETLGKSLDAERKAGATKDARDATFANQQDQLEKEADDAAANGTSPLDALFDQLR